MAYKISGNTVIRETTGDDFGFANVTIQNNGYLLVDSADTFQGTVAGYTSGGFSGGPASVNIVDKFPFSSDTNATDVGDLTVARNTTGGQSSATHGYASGGAVEAPPIITNNKTIDKFPFSSDTNASDVGDLITDARGQTGQSSSTSGYVSGGFPSSNTIEKFPFSSDSNTTDVGDLTVAGRYYAAGQSSVTHGYTSGGGYSNTNTIDKFPFATNANATDVGDLTVVRQQLAGQSSTTHGYSTGGGPGALNTIDKFPFSSDTNASDVGDLTAGKKRIAGQSSSAFGYVSGGEPAISTIEKFPFASDTNASSVGALTRGRNTIAGQQD